MLQITIDGTDVSSNLISYTREKDLCSSEGIVELELASHLSISTYDVILAYEDSNLKGTFYVDSMEFIPDGRMTVHGRDNSKRAQDYFIPEQYIVEGDTTSRYWIEFFLGMAGISYNFTTIDTGYTIQDGEALGLASVQEVVENLVRYSGWYIYYDASNVAQIGKLDYDATSYKASYDDTDIVSINHLKNDMYLRNRAVVWGAGYKGDQEWVFADISVNTPWNYDSEDKRAILARAGFPIPYSQAMGTAQVLLNEYSRLVEEKTITLHGFHNLEIGEFVLINSNYYTGVGLIAQINVTTTEDSGYKTTIVLDRRCPRFVGFYDIGGIIYAGTEADGVWTKPLNGPHTWADYSTGLTDLNVVDLDVSYGVASCTTFDGNLHYRTVGDASWYPMSHGIHYTESGEAVTSGVYVASNINDIDQTVYGLFVASGVERTWVDSFYGTNRFNSQLVTVSGNSYYRGKDIESNFDDVFVAVDRGESVIFRNSNWNQYITTDPLYFNRIVIPSGNIFGRFSDRYYIYGAQGELRIKLEDLSVESMYTNPNGYVGSPLCLLENEVMVGLDTYGNFGYADWKNQDLGFVGVTLDNPLPGNYFSTPLYVTGSPVVTERPDKRIITFVDLEAVDFYTNKLHFRCINIATGENKDIEIDDGYKYSFPGPNGAYNFLPLFVSGDFVYNITFLYDSSTSSIIGCVFIKINPEEGTVVSKNYHLISSTQYDLYYPNNGESAYTDAVNIFCDDEESIYFVGGIYLNYSYKPPAIWKYSFETETYEFIYCHPSYLSRPYALFTINGKPYAIESYSVTNECKIVNLQTKSVLSTITLEITNKRSILRYGTGYLGSGLLWMVAIDEPIVDTFRLEGYNLSGTKVYDFLVDTNINIPNLGKTNFGIWGVRDSTNQINKFVLPGGPYGDSRNLIVIEFNDSPFASGGGGNILRLRNGEFETVFRAAGSLKIDISTPNVVSTYMTVVSSGVLTISGEPYNYGTSLGNLWYSPFGDYGTFGLLHLPSMSGSYINDVRSFTLISGDGYRTCLGFVVLSGLFGSVGQFSYIDVSEYSEMGGTIVFPDIHTVESFNAVPVALETSNYNYMETPYFLVGLSGVASPFLQRDADTETFVNRSTSFPESRITTIRLDDMI